MSSQTTQVPVVDESVQRIAASYAAAFEGSDVSAFQAHLSVARSGMRLSKAVGQFLEADYGLNPARFSLLRTLYFSEGHRLQQSELAKALNVTAPNVTQLIDTMQRDGLVSRVVSQADRRVTFARLTSKGAALCKEAVPAMAQFMQQTVAVFSSAEMDQLTELLARFRQHLAQLGEPTE